MFRILIGVSLFLTLKLFAVGAWYKNTEEIPQAKTGSFSPNFVIMKWGVFSKKGHLTLSKTATNAYLKTHCSKSLDSIAWVTHSLAPGEMLNQKSGKALGTQLAKTLSNTCFSSVELDLEPLKSAQAWLEPFLKGVKETLPKRFKLRLAVPVISLKALPGKFWSLRDGVKGMQWVDGLDIMTYDSGVKNSKEYSEVFKGALFFTIELIKQSPDKDVIIGLPAYDDKTKLHTQETENLETVLATLKPFTPFQLKSLCEGKIRFAYYAGWTLSKKDHDTHKQIEEWTNGICKKAP